MQQVIDTLLAACASQGSRPKPGDRRATSATSMPKPRPSKFSSRPSSRAIVTPARPTRENCQPVPLGA